MSAMPPLATIGAKLKKHADKEQIETILKINFGDELIEQAITSNIFIQLACSHQLIYPANSKSTAYPCCFIHLNRQLLLKAEVMSLLCYVNG